MNPIKSDQSQVSNAMTSFVDYNYWSRFFSTSWEKIWVTGWKLKTQKFPALKHSWYYNFSWNSTNLKKVQGSLRSQLWPGQNKNLRSNIKCQHSHLIQHKTILSINLADSHVSLDSVFEFCALFVVRPFGKIPKIPTTFTIFTQNCHFGRELLGIWVSHFLERMNQSYYILKHVFQDAEMSKKSNYQPKVKTLTWDLNW